MYVFMNTAASTNCTETMIIKQNMKKKKESKKNYVILLYILIL